MPLGIFTSKSVSCRISVLKLLLARNCHSYCCRRYELRSSLPELATRPQFRKSDLHKKLAFTLAEGTTHVAHYDKYRRVAFTLAEVLIALGIIGVVAALTLPTVIQNYQKHVTVTKLKQTVSILEQFHQRVIAEEGSIGVFHGTAKTRYIDGIMTDGNLWGSLASSSYPYITKYLQVVKLNSGGPKYFYLNKNVTSSHYFTISSNGPSYVLSNGVEIHIDTYSGRVLTNGFISSTGYSYGLYYVIDTNGFYNSPNVVGRDQFRFFVENNGHLVPQGSKEYAIKQFANKDKTEEEALNTTYYWKKAGVTSNNGCRKENYTGPGYGCTGRIVDEGWKINY